MNSLLTLAKIRQTQKDLKRKFFNIDIIAQEEKRQKKRKQENSLKSKTCKQKRLAHSSLVLFHEITGIKADQTAGMKITRNDMINFMQKLKPKHRFQLEPMRNLKKETWFEEDAKEKANEFVAMLAMHAEQTAKDASARKERLLVMKKCQKITTEN